jgi:hypothetical protein
MCQKCAPRVLVALLSDGARKGLGDSRKENPLSASPYCAEHPRQDTELDYYLRPPRQQGVGVSSLSNERDLAPRHRRAVALAGVV